MAAFVASGARAASAQALAETQARDIIAPWNRLFNVAAELTSQPFRSKF
jgi:hypothetical protein